MKITVKETPVMTDELTQAVRSAHASGVELQRLDMLRRCEEISKKELDAKIAHLSRTEKTYFLELTAREAVVLGNVLGSVRVGEVHGPWSVVRDLHAGLCSVGAYQGNGKLVAPVMDWMVGQVRLVDVWPEDLR